MPKIVPNLWFDTEAEEAAEFYISVFKNSRVLNVTHYSEAGPREAGMVMTVEFELDGQRFVGINGGPEFKFDEAVSFQIDCETQDDVDYYWERLSEGGEEGQCGWLKDSYGLSWQVVPTGMEELFADSDPKRAERAMQAMFGMRKLDIAALRRPTASRRRDVSSAWDALPVRLNHVALTVSDRDRSAAFYGEHFGLTTRLHDDQHLLILSSGSGAVLALTQGPPPELPRTNHFGFQLETMDEVHVARRRLQEAGVPEAEWQDSPGMARVQVLDPDGYLVDVYAF